MSSFRSKLFSLFLALWTLVLGLGIPFLMIGRSSRRVRAYSRFWASGVQWGLGNIVGLRYRVEGTLPDDGKPRLIICNHQSAWETLIFITVFRNLSFVAKKELSRVPIFGWFLTNYPMIMIDRQGGRATLVQMLRQAQSAIDQGLSILIFPEGTRIDVHETRPFEVGVAALYRKLGVPALTLAHNSGCFWKGGGSGLAAGEITLRVIEEIPPGLGQAEFLQRIESTINREKAALAESC
ncbi:1-acyl-sn-glycerol-3-phosphate acyltransferase [Faunimonas pinastri]|uniref:1-acyl-sn-glycerol-3-phosphate acyltransferase n=1 Tax=Faunimonas pinastri TaxID=1855383 RepID=A0A1H9LKC3_9HYPH|nr:lysophospholipid acyltransferase family protein [Faunimonas pinastri]SER11679.1 1-acyl-sn-glycerol-3-phosphate acyltransferase [Faunimonas pinastri]